VLATLALAWLSAGCARRAAEPPPLKSPRLMLFLVVDQMRYDYVERMDPLFSGGLRRLLDEGISFTEAHHDHAVTNTAPGHATLATGRHPARSGIVGNYWIDREAEEWVYCVEDPHYGTAPTNLLAPTLADWLRDRYPTARTFAVSGKDRGAVLVAGWHADGAFWYDRETGAIITSSYYREPEWLADFNDEDFPAQWFGRLWEPLPVDEEAARRADIEDLDEGPFGREFPHHVGGAGLSPGEGFYGSFYSTPFLDRYVAHFARRLIEEESLGQDEIPDFLSVSFSALDTVGHDYGPNSPEVLDVLLRLDRVVGDLLDFVDRRVGLENVLVSLTSDHGVVPLPELRRLRGLPGRRYDSRDVQCVQRAGRELLGELGFDPWIEQSTTLDVPEVEAEGREPAEVLREADRLLSRCPEVREVWTAEELSALPADEELGEVKRRYRNSFHPERSPHLYVQLDEYGLGLLGWMTTHGSVYHYDRRVPLVIRRPDGGFGRVVEPVRTVDLAPTLAQLLGVPTPDDLDGVSRAQELSRVRAPRVQRTPETGAGQGP